MSTIFSCEEFTIVLESKKEKKKRKNENSIILAILREKEKRIYTVFSNKYQYLK